MFDLCFLWKFEMRLIYIHRTIYNQICDILSNKNVTLFDYEEHFLNIIRREIKSDHFKILDGNILIDENDNQYKLIIM